MTQMDRHFFVHESVFLTNSSSERLKWLTHKWYFSIIKMIQIKFKIIKIKFNTDKAEQTSRNTRSNE